VRRVIVARMFAVRMLVVLAILVPVYAIRQPHGITETFVIALVAFGTGHLVEAIVVARRKKAAARQSGKPLE
jgi:hypothetical protein